MASFRVVAKSILEKLAFLLVNYLLLKAVSSSYARWAKTQVQQPPPFWRGYYVFYGIYAFVVLLVVNLSYTLLYICQFKSVEKYKIQPGPWPWRDGSFFSAKNIASIKTVTFSILVVLNVLSLLLVTTLTTDMRVETLPSFGEHLLCFAVNLFVEDFTFYFFHLLLHTQWFYRNVHKKHHDANMVVCWATLDNHWLETFFSGVTTFSGGWVLGRRMHFVSLMVFASLRVWESHDVHSGYKLPFSLFNLFPFMVDPPYHDFHHSANSGNYSMTLKFWDWYFGTIKPYRRFQEARRLEKSSEAAFS